MVDVHNDSEDDGAHRSAVANQTGQRPSAVSSRPFHLAAFFLIEQD
jgi:hypothetical protein